MTLDLRFVVDNFRISRLAWSAMDNSYGQVNRGDPLVAIDNTGTGRLQPFETPSGFVAREVIADPTTNFKAVIYQNIDTNEVVVSLMGTNGWGDVKGWNTNLTSYGYEQWKSVYADPSNPDQLSNGDRVFYALAGYVDSDTKLIVAGDSKGVMLGQYFTDELAHRITGDYALLNKPQFSEAAGTENLLSLSNNNIRGSRGQF